MRPWRNTLIILTVFFLTGGTEAATVLYDDFEDGSATDGIPVAWLESEMFSGTFDASSGDYFLAPSERAIVATAPGFNVPDVSIRSQFRILTPSAPGGGVELLARVDLANVDAYLGGLNEAGTAYIAPSGTALDLVSINTNLHPLDEDIVMQFDVFGDLLSLWAWPADEPMPPEPLITATDSRFLTGEVGIAYYSLQASNDLGNAIFRFVQVADKHIPARPILLGDFNNDAILDASDVDALTAQIRSTSTDTYYDVNADDQVTLDDLDWWVHELKNTWFGDADLSGAFDSADFVQVFQAGKYETGLAAGWADGDWSGDGSF